MPSLAFYPHFNDLPPSVRRKVCQRLGISGSGVRDYAKQLNPPCTVLLAGARTPVGWACLFEPYQCEIPRREVHVFVAPGYRRKGHGTRLVATLLRNTAHRVNRVTAYPQNDGGTKFFATVFPAMRRI